MSDLSESFVASIARTPNSNQVPCDLSGHYLLNVHAIPSIIGTTVFRGHKALARLGSLRPCTDQAVFPSSSQERQTRPPAFHMHVHDSEVTVALFSRSETIWFLFPLDASFMSTGETQIFLALPPCVGSDYSATSAAGSRIMVSASRTVISLSFPKISCFARSLSASICARLGESVEGRLQCQSSAMSRSNINDDGLLDASQLPEPLRTAYGKLRQAMKPSSSVDG